MINRFARVQCIEPVMAKAGGTRSLCLLQFGQWWFICDVAHVHHQLKWALGRGNVLRAFERLVRDGLLAIL